MKKLLFVYNPHSGTGAVGNNIAKIIEIFTASGYDVTVHPTCAALDGQNYIIKNSEGYDIIVNSGGDGMLHELVNAAITLKKGRYGYIPAGTINDFASSLNIPKDMVAAAEMIMRENFISLDAGKFNESYYSYVAAFGILTDVSYSTDQRAKNALGAAAYLFNALKSIDLRKFYENSTRLSIEVNGERLEDEFVFGLCGNSYSVGGMKNVIPKTANMQDGLLDGIFVKTPTTFVELELLKKALVNRDFGYEKIVCTQSDKFVIQSEKEIAWTLDGEDGGKTETAEISVIHNAYEIAVPTLDNKSNSDLTI